MKNETRGNDSPIITGNHGPIIYKPVIGGNNSVVKPFTECSNDELLLYGQELASRFKEERKSKRKLIIQRVSKMFLMPIIILIVAVVYVLINSQDRHILDIAMFICTIFALIIAYAGIINWTKPNNTEKDYLSTGDNIIRELNFRQCKREAEQIRQGFK